MRYVLLALACCGGASAAGVPPEAYDAGAPLNPRHEGQPVILGYDSHHPDCFVMRDGAETESVACPDEALSLLEGCRGGKLFRARDREGCVCVPVGEEPAERVDCP